MTSSAMELLAPAGSWDAMVAAVRCGADAVYLGGGDFNARRHATGFVADPAAPHSLRAATAFCHARGVKVYVALNTLVTDRELPAALDVAKAAAEAGADALILQDRGLARCVRAVCPTVRLHASTQLTCHTPAGADRLREDGFCRVVLAREMTESEIAACAEHGLELEVFVHGALCMSVSGQCLLSAMLGGRSGNRGLCAQPCRLPFAADRVPKGDCALSLKDNSLIHHLPALQRAGVTSLKIEGRMKRPEYVAAAVSSFRRALDGLPTDQQLEKDLQAVFSRSGFTDGYFTGKRDTTMFGTRRYEDVTAADRGVFTRLSRLYEKERPAVAVVAHFTLLPHGSFLMLSDGTHTVTVTGPCPEQAQTRPLSRERVAEQLQKTGGTPVWVSDVTAEMGAGLTLPLSAINALRREAVTALLTARAAAPAPTFGEVPPVTTLPDGLLSGVVARVADASQIHGTADWWVVPLGVTPAVPCFGVEIPRGLFGKEDVLRRQLKTAAQNGATFALCGNIGAFSLAQEAGLSPVAGWSMHITNAHALAAAAESGAQAAVLSSELTFPQQRFAENNGCVGLFAYGRQPLMLMRNCPVKGADGCAACGGNGHTLLDRKGAVFPVMCNGGCAELLNSVPLYLADRLPQLQRYAFVYLHFTDESPERVAQVVEEYRVGGTPPSAFTRGLYDKGWVKE